MASAPALTYTPAVNYNGPDGFTFTVNDGSLDSPSATVSITITAVNDPPVANNQSVGTAEDTPLAITLTATDVDGNPLTYGIANPPAHGTLSGTAPNVTYTPAATYNGPDSFTFTANDGALDSNVATVSVTVSNINNAPVANDQSVTSDEDIAKAITLAATDVDGNPLTYGIVTLPAHGTLSGTAPNMTYTPSTNYNGPDSFTFKANDGFLDSNEATVSITVTAANDAPVADPQSVSTPEDAPKTIILSANDLDNVSLTFTIVNLPAHGTLSAVVPDPCTPDGGGGYLCTATVTYTPTSNYNGSDSFTFKANDGTSDSNTASVSVGVNALNDGPAASDGTAITSEDVPTTVTLTGTDPDGNTLIFSILSTPGDGTLGTISDPSCAVDGAGVATCTATAAYTPAGNYNGPDSFTFKAYDGNVDSNTATITITINPANDAPVASDQSPSTEEDTAKVITLSATDIDGNSLAFSVTGGPAHGILSAIDPVSCTPDGSGGSVCTATVGYTPTADYNGPDSLTFKVNDGILDSNEATVTITVNAVNDAPVAADNSYDTGEDVTLNVPAPGVLGNDTDAESNPLTAVLVNGPAHGALSLNANGSFTYTPAGNYSGPDSFTYKANDGSADSNVATVSITVNAVNDLPVAADNSYDTNEDGTLNVAASGVLGNDTDAEGSSLTAILVSTTGHGALTLNANGSFTYTPVANYNGPDSFTYKANDGSSDSNVATVSITVNAINDQPIANAQSVTTPEDTALIISLTGSDVEGSLLTFATVTQPTHGTLSGTPPALTYTPAANYNGPDNFTFKVNDGTVDSGPATVSINVTPVNDPPVATADTKSTTQNTPLTFPASDLMTNDSKGPADENGQSLTVTAVSAASSQGGTVSLGAGNITYTPPTGFSGRRQLHLHRLRQWNAISLCRWVSECHGHRSSQLCPSI